MKPVSPIIPGLEEEEIVIAKDQEEYKPLPALKVADGYILTRWEFTEKDIENIQKTNSLYLYMLVGDGPVTPILLQTEHPIPAEQELIDQRK